MKEQEVINFSVNRSSLLRWAGSKRKLLPSLRESVPKDFNRYIEPFCGSISLFILLQPRSALLGDVNWELINFYHQLKQNPEEIARLVHGMPSEESFYYELRSVSPSSLAYLDRAARFFYLNRFCFNGVYRTNKKGDFNVPRGKHMGAIPTREEIISFASLIANAEFHAIDFEILIKNARVNDFIYLDPPYAGRDVKDRGEYGLNSFRENDIERLVVSVQAAAKAGAKVLLSYADVPVIRDLLGDWNIKTISVGRNVSGFIKGRTTVSEVIITNY